MEVLSAEQLNAWFARFPNRGAEEIHCNYKEVFFTHPEANCIDIEYPAKLERLPFFARCLATLQYEAIHFDGAVLWFTGWGVWNSLDEGIGYRIVEAMHRATGQPQSFEAAPGHLFRADEWNDAIGMLIQPMIFGWDAIFIPRWSYGADEFFLHVSHDSFVSIVTRTKEFHETAFALLQKLDFNPQPGHELTTRRFCRVS